MNIDSIDKAFEKLISQRGIYKKLDISQNNSTQLRWKLKNGIGISTDLKLELLQKSGWRQDDKTFTQKDLVNVVKHALKKGAAAKSLGAEYIVEDFLKKK